MPVPLDGDGEAYRPEPGHTLSILKHAGKLWGTDDERSDEDPVPLSRADLVRYRLSLDAVAQMLHDANELEGEVCQISPQLHYVGRCERGGMVNAVLLALFSDEAQAVESALSVPSHVASQHERYVLVCPSFGLADQNDVRRLEDAHVLLTRMTTTDLWRVVWPTSAVGGHTTGMGAKLLTISKGGAFCTYAGQRVKLSPIQGKLLVALARRPGKPLDYYALARAGWPDGIADRANVRAMIKALRDKLKQAAKSAEESGIEVPENPIDTRRGRFDDSGTYTLVLRPSQVEVLQADQV